MSGFRFLPHSVTSDVAFEATGHTINALFANAAVATFSVMADINKVKPEKRSIINLGASTLEDLLFDFLNELIFLKDKDSMLFSKFNIAITDNKLTAHIFGEKIDPKRHHLGVDVKAVTKHNFGISKEKGYYKATVVLDI